MVRASTMTSSAVMRSPHRLPIILTNKQLLVVVRHLLQKCRNARPLRTHVPPERSAHTQQLHTGGQETWQNRAACSTGGQAILPKGLPKPL